MGAGRENVAESRGHCLSSQSTRWDSGCLGGCFVLDKRYYSLWACTLLFRLHLICNGTRGSAWLWRCRVCIDFAFPACDLSGRVLAFHDRSHNFSIASVFITYRHWSSGGYHFVRGLLGRSVLYLNRIDRISIESAGVWFRAQLSARCPGVRCISLPIRRYLRLDPHSTCFAYLLVCEWSDYLRRRRRQFVIIFLR